jgi:DnaK suppressor protein
MECAPTRRAPISYLGDAMAERTKTKRTATRSTTTGSTATKGAAGRGAKPHAGGVSQSTATKSAATKPAAAKPAATKPTAKRSAATATKPTRSAAETERIREALIARRDELREEYSVHLAEIAELQRGRFTDSAGDDQADTGSKTFEREQEISLAHSILERTAQVERALERLDEGSYGWCERCGNAIPVERLAAFPSATLCVTCKQLEERR